MEASRYHDLLDEYSSDTQSAQEPSNPEDTTEENILAAETISILQINEMAILLEEAVKEGLVVGVEEIAKILDDLDVSPEITDGVYQAIEEIGIEINPAQVGSVDERPYQVKEDEGKNISLDAIQLFLRDTHKHPLLTAAGEVELSKLIQAGIEAEKNMEELNISVTGQEVVAELKRVELEKSIEDGLQAKRKMLESNIRLVVSIAKRYRNSGLPLLDLIQEGVVGLNRAAEKFDWRMGYKFSTYATWWIRQAVARSLADKARTIRMPVHIVEKLNKIVNSERRLRGELGREPEKWEIAEDLRFTEEEVAEILRSAQPPVSLEKPVGDEEESEYGHFIADESTLPPDEEVHITFRNEMLERAPGNLQARQLLVLKLRYGLQDEYPCTLEEIGRRLGVTRERVRQIEKEALRRLRSMPETEGLKGE